MYVYVLVKSPSPVDFCMQLHGDELSKMPTIVLALLNYT